MASSGPEHLTSPGQSIMKDGRTLTQWVEIEEEVKSNRNYVHPCEQRALDKLIAEHDVARHSFWTEKRLLVFLFARKLDVERTAELLDNHLSWRKENNFMRNVNVREVNEELLRCGYTFPGRIGDRDSKGRGLSYIVLSRFQASQYSTKDLLTYLVFVYDLLVERETLDMFRLGVTTVEDIGGSGFSNMMGRSAGKELMSAIQNNFPLRYSSILIVNAGFFVKVLLAFARLFMKAKLVNRVELVTTEELKQRVHTSCLPKVFGGDLQWDAGEFLKYVFESEEEKTDDSIGSPVNEERDDGNLSSVHPSDAGQSTIENSNASPQLNTQPANDPLSGDVVVPADT